MKVAVIFTGFFRSFNDTKQSFKEYIMDPLSPDIFFSAPKTLFTLPKDEDCGKVIKISYVPPSNHSIYEKLVEPEIIDFFGDKLKAYELIDYDCAPYKKLCEEHNIPYYSRDGLPTFRILSQLTNKELSMKVFKRYVEKHNLNYDLVIMTRGDLKYFSPFDFNSINLNSIGYPNQNKNQGPFLPSWYSPLHKIKTPKAFGDILLIGSQKNMLVWCNFVQSFFNFFKEGLFFTAENIMAYHLIQNNMDWYGSNYIEFELHRQDI